MSEKPISPLRQRMIEDMTVSLPAAPRTDPYGPNSGIRLLPRVSDGKALSCLPYASERLGHTGPALCPVLLCSPAFLLVPALGSTGSAAGCPALFVGFAATMAESDFPRPCIIGFGSSPSRCGPVQRALRALPAGRGTSRFPYKKLPRMPGSVTTPGRPALASGAPVRMAVIGFMVIDKTFPRHSVVGPHGPTLGPACACPGVEPGARTSCLGCRQTRQFENSILPPCDQAPPGPP